MVSCDVHTRILETLTANPLSKVSIDLATQTLTLPDGSNTEFPVDAFSTTCRMEGVDELGFLLKHTVQIDALGAANPAALDTRSIKM